MIWVEGNRGAKREERFDTGWFKNHHMWYRVNQKITNFFSFFHSFIYLLIDSFFLFSSIHFLFLFLSLFLSVFLSFFLLFFLPETVYVTKTNIKWLLEISRGPLLIKSPKRFNLKWFWAFVFIQVFYAKFSSSRFGLWCIKPNVHLALMLALTLTLKPSPSPSHNLTPALTLNNNPFWMS